MPNVDVQAEETQDQFRAIVHLRISNRCRTSGAAKHWIRVNCYRQLLQTNFWCLNYEHKFLHRKGDGWSPENTSTSEIGIRVLTASTFDKSRSATANPVESRSVVTIFFNQPVRPMYVYNSRFTQCWDKKNTSTNMQYAIPGQLYFPWQSFQCSGC